MITREQWRDRLIKANLPEDVVDNLMAQLKDEDLVRMKDLSTEQYLDMVSAGLDAVVTKESKKKKMPMDEDEEDEEDMSTSKEGGKVAVAAETPSGDAGVAVAGLSASDIDKIAKKVASMLGTSMKDLLTVQEIEVTVPELAEIMASQKVITEHVEALSVVVKDMTEVLSTTLKDESEMLESQFDGMSPASRSRLQQSLANVRTAKQDTERAATFKAQLRAAALKDVEPVATNSDAVVMDYDGNQYGSLSEMASAG